MLQNRLMSSAHCVGWSCICCHATVGQTDLPEKHRARSTGPEGVECDGCWVTNGQQRRTTARITSYIRRALSSPLSPYVCSCARCAARCTTPATTDLWRSDSWQAGSCTRTPQRSTAQLLSTAESTVYPKKHRQQLLSGDQASKHSTACTAILLSPTHKPYKQSSPVAAARLSEVTGA